TVRELFEALPVEAMEGIAAIEEAAVSRTCLIAPAPRPLGRGDPPFYVRCRSFYGRTNARFYPGRTCLLVRPG
ncbi:MAG: hypothetical protein ACFB0F_07780, partial [Neomegalonema sp.]